MVLSSDDESSESSGDEYLVTPGKLDLDSTFFQAKPSSSKASQSASKDAESSDDDSDDFVADGEQALDSNALLAEVMKNLERINNKPSSNDEKEPENSSDLRPTGATSPSEKRNKNVLSDEITSLLLQGESGASSSNFQVESNDEDEAEEKPKDYVVPKEGVNITLPGTAMMMFGRRKKRDHDFEDELRKKLNRRLRLNQVNIHKVGLLCWLAHGFHLNVVVNDVEILSTAMSLMPSSGYPKGRVDLKYLEQFTKWFKNLFKLEFRDGGDGVRRDSLLARLRERKVCNYREMVLLYAATLRAIGLNCRIVVSLCAPPLKPSQDQLFQNASKPKEETKKPEKKTRDAAKCKKEAMRKGRNAGKVEESKKSSEESPSKIVPENSEETRKQSKTDARKRAAEVLAKFANKDSKKSIKSLMSKENVQESSKSQKEDVVTSPPKLRQLRSRTIGQSSETGGKSKNVEEEKVKSETSPGKRTRAARIVKPQIASTSTMSDTDSEDAFEAKPPVKKKKDNSKDKDKSAQDRGESKNELKSEVGRNKINLKSLKNTSSNVKKNHTVTDEYSDEETLSKLSVIKKKTNAQSVDVSSEDDSESDNTKNKKMIVSKNSKKKVVNNSDSDSDFKVRPPTKKKKVDTVKEESKTKSKNRDSIDRRVLSSEEEPAELLDAKSAQNIWVEVYVEAEESWISVSVVDNKIHCISEIYKKAPKPVLYVIAWNSVGSLKDVTRRYCPHWLTVTRKQRIDESWWVETLSPWVEKSTAISRAEDEMLLQRELEQPLPKTVGECKGHPLYALARHLLKFEAIYPPESVPLGHLRTGEAIYSRHCVHTLYSRETWLKKARVVKPAQDAYKIVKSMPKYDKLSGMRLPDQPLQLFGKWQTTEYVPPVAQDGIVPRNEYGNVDLFKQCMLPIGTVHINLPALNRVARKLNIDCVPAVVGFNFGARGALPAIEGYVVCKEFEETLRAAWQQDQIESAKRAVEKRENRIYGNWKKLIKGLFIRERLAARYDFKAGDDDTDKKPSASTKRTSKKVVELKKVNGKKTKKS